MEFEGSSSFSKAIILFQMHSKLIAVKINTVKIYQAIQKVTDHIYTNKIETGNQSPEIASLS